MKEEKGSSKKKLIQRILRRPIEMYIGADETKSVRISASDEWKSIFLGYWDTEESLQKLMKEGWKVISITQSLAPKNDQYTSYIYGIETVIIEKEYYE